MKTKFALSTLADIEGLLDSAKTSDHALTASEAWKRDKEFVTVVRDYLESDDLDGVQWSLHQMRNLSQGFGSYAKHIRQLNQLVDRLYQELATIVVESR